VNDNTGCAVVEADKASYGEAFATGGGGVFVTELAESASLAFPSFFCDNVLI
jgi:hypothetical protein